MVNNNNTKVGSLCILVRLSGSVVIYSLSKVGKVNRYSIKTILFGQLYNVFMCKYDTGSSIKILKFKKSTRFPEPNTHELLLIANF